MKIPSLFGRLIPGRADIKQAQAAHSEIDAQEAMLFGGPSLSTPLIAAGQNARMRDQIYAMWAEMAACPVIHAAAKLQTTAALGGHETTGDIVFIEPTPAAREGRGEAARLVDEIARDVAPLLNRHIYAMGYTGFIYGDAYARLYTEPRVGLVDMRTDHFVRPELVLPYERGNETVGYVVASQYDSGPIKLTPLQMARAKMAREQYVPQQGVLFKALRLSLATDELAALPPLPSEVGGSVLYAAEGPYRDLMAALTGISGQRLVDSIDESIVTANFKDMTKPQREILKTSLGNMFKLSKQYAEQVLKERQPIITRIRHLIPVFNDKQVVQIGQPLAARGTSISIDDAMLYARLLAGALGTDLSMLGFADQLAGGLGEGGFFRVSAQGAEIARHQRTALSDAIHHIIAVHMLARYGGRFDQTNLPYTVSFYGGISALQKEKQENQATAMQSAMQMVQTMGAAKQLGMDARQMELLLSRFMLVDQDMARQFAAVADAQGTDDEPV